MAQTAAINTSLMELGKVVRKLHEKQEKPHDQVHVDYRASKLTHILQDALGGDSGQTMFIVNLSPLATDASASKSALDFATGLRSVKTGAGRLKEENASLRERLRKALAICQKQQEALNGFRGKRTGAAQGSAQDKRNR